jgi:hypothetical protein
MARYFFLGGGVVEHIGKIQRDIVINLETFSGKVPAIRVRFE